MTFTIDFVVSDDAGNESKTGIYVPDTFLKADYDEFATTQATILDAILAGRVVNASLCIDIDLSGLAANTADPTADVEEVGAFVFSTIGLDDVDINLPTLNEDKVVPGTRQLDTADNDVVNFVTAIEAGLTATSTNVIQPTDIANVDIDELVEATEESRNSGRYKL